MPKSKSRLTARAASSGGLPKHPALGNPDPLLSYRMGSSEPLRLPDAENEPTAATVLRSEYTLSSDAAGELCFAESPAPASAKSVWTVTAGTTGASPTATAHPQNTAFVGEALWARMVAMRITVTYIGVEQDASGYLSFAEKFDISDINSKSVDALHTGAHIQVAANDGLVTLVDYTQQPRWEPASSASFSFGTYPYALFIASGLPFSKAVYRVRVERFMEYLPKEGALAEGELRHEPHNPGALSVHGELSGNATSVTSVATQPSFLSKVKAAANAAYHVAQPLMPYVVPRASAYLASLAGSSSYGALAGRLAPLMLTM